MSISACDGCSRPGACCQRFSLSGTDDTPLVFWNRHGIGGPLAYAAKLGLPFVPIEPSENFTTMDGEYAGFDYQSWSWGCSNLLPNGRCGDYENRPEVCRSYEPLSTPLCAHHSSRLIEWKP